MIVIGGCKDVLEGLITYRKCDNPHGGFKGVSKVCQLIEKCDTHGRSEHELVSVDGEV